MVLYDPLYDPLIHPGFLDPRQWADVNLYELVPPVEREPLTGKEQWRRDRFFEVRHLRLDLRFDDESESISGSAQISLSPLIDNLDHIELDAAELSIREVAIAGDKLEFECREEKLLVELGRHYPRLSELRVDIAYSCRPRKGLFFVKPDGPDGGYPGKPRQIWSQGQNEDAHWWFPCADVTNQKMTTELIATVREDFFALSNGSLLAVTENPQERTKTYHWSQQQPHPAYLVTVVAGQYEKISDHYGALPVDYYVYADRRDEGRRLFANTPRMLEFFESRFGYPYPFAGYSQILVDDFLFGAMENTSATTMTDRVLLDDRATIDVDYDDIVAHELAHQWWGDLVTCKDWTEIWLNEGFATYSEFLWRETTRGSDEARFALFQDSLVYLREDRKSHRRPMVCHRYRYSEELMDRHAYEKGAFVLSMLRATLGDDGFFRSLAHYLKKHAFGVVETADLRVAIEEATGRNLSWFFDQWVLGDGIPELEVQYEWQREEKTIRLLVKQVQSRDGETRLFKLPVEIEIVSAEGVESERRDSYRVIIETAQQELYFPCANRPRLVVFDKGHRLLKLLRFPKSTEELLYQVRHDSDMLGRVRAARELSAVRTEDIARELRSVIEGDDFWGVRLAAALSLGELATTEARDALLAVFPTCREPRVRRGIACALGSYKDEEAVSVLARALQEDESYFVAAGAARALANIGSQEAYDILTRSLSGSSWQEVVRVAIFHGFAVAREKRAVDGALRHTQYGEHPAVRVAAIACLGALGKELHADGKDNLVVDHLIDLLKDKSIRARVAAIRALGKVGNGRALGPLREARRRECLDQLKGALEDALEAIEKAGKKKAPADIAS